MISPSVAMASSRRRFTCFNDRSFQCSVLSSIYSRGSPLYKKQRGFFIHRDFFQIFTRFISRFFRCIWYILILVKHYLISFNEGLLKISAGSFTISVSNILTSFKDASLWFRSITVLLKDG